MDNLSTRRKIAIIITSIIDECENDGSLFKEEYEEFVIKYVLKRLREWEEARKVLEELYKQDIDPNKNKWWE